MFDPHAFDSIHADRSVQKPPDLPTGFASFLLQSANQLVQILSLGPGERASGLGQMIMDVTRRNLIYRAIEPLIHFRLPLLMMSPDAWLPTSPWKVCCTV